MVVNLTWADIERDIKVLVEKLKNKRFTKIVAITTGGLIPAYYLAKRLNIPYMDVLCLSSYKGTKRGKVKVIPYTKEADSRFGWLIVDDLVDSGETIKVAKAYYPHSRIATIYTKKESPKPDFFVKEFEKEEWLHFPWED